jgi:hypothetical protein
MAENILAKGIRSFPKRENQPDFVLGSVIITLNELIAFCKENPTYLTEYNGQKQLRLQLLKSKAGEPYLTVDTFKPQAAPAPKAADKEEDNDLPF